MTNKIDKNSQFDIAIIGGGAAGFFAAINVAEKNPNLKIIILEKGNEVLQKVKVSGGGRCNLTNACVEINQFVKHYPRGEKELRSSFQRFGNLDTMHWFDSKGVALKTELDGRVFPKSENSQTIIDLFVSQAKKWNIEVKLQQNVESFIQKTTDFWEIQTQENTYLSKNLLITTGSNTKIWKLLNALGHNIIEPVPSLFTFTIADKNLHQLMGVSQEVTLKIKDSPFVQTGNMLITHWGLSGPAVLKLSAFGARHLSEKEYQFSLQVNWLKDKTYDQVMEQLKSLKQTHSKKNLFKNPQFGFTHRLWEYLVVKSHIPENLNFADISKQHLQNLSLTLTQTNYSVNGKSTFKEEFVTAGGVDLKEVNFKTMESKLFSNLYFAGEVLNIDAVTGGFNFQNAWTGAWIFSENVV